MNVIISIWFSLYTKFKRI